MQCMTIHKIKLLWGFYCPEYVTAVYKGCRSGGLRVNFDQLGLLNVQPKHGTVQEIKMTLNSEPQEMLCASW